MFVAFCEVGVRKGVWSEGGCKGDGFLLKISEGKILVHAYEKRYSLINA